MDNDLIKILTLCFDKAPEEAVKFMQSRGIQITWDWKEQLDAIKSMAFTVAKVSSADILQGIKDEIDLAMENGRTYEEFKESITDLLDRKGFQKREDGTAWRLDTIYRTNLQSAFMAGRYNQMVAVKDSFPNWELVAVMDNRTTDGCKSINGTILPADDPFWQTNYPPRHYKCRDRVRALNNTQLQRRGLNLTNPDKVANVKPSEGFDTNPGEWKPDLSKYDNEIQSALKKEIGV